MMPEFGTCLYACRDMGPPGSRDYYYFYRPVTAALFIGHQFLSFLCSLVPLFTHYWLVSHMYLRLLYSVRQLVSLRLYSANRNS